MPKSIRYTKTDVSSFAVTVKVKGKWIKAKLSQNGAAFVVPAGATQSRTYLKTKGKNVLLEDKKRKRSKNPASLGRKRLLKRLSSRTPARPNAKNYQLLLDYLTEVLGEDFGLSSGLLPTSTYHDQARFFTAESELKKNWLYIRIWFAIESDGMSDGTVLDEQAKAYYIDSIGVSLASPGEKLSRGLMEKYSRKVEDTLFNASEIQKEQGWVNRHNDDPRFKKWAPSAIYLGVEGDLRRTAAHAAKTKRFRAGRKVSNAKPRYRAGH